MQPMQLGEQVAKQLLFCYDSFWGVQVLCLFIAFELYEWISGT